MKSIFASFAAITVATAFLNEVGAASLALGPGGLTKAHPAGGPPNTLLKYIDPSGIEILYSKPDQANFTGISGLNSRGWSHDGDSDVLGFTEIAGVRPDHLSIAHFRGADQVNISFANAANVDLSTVKLHIWDLDTNGTSQFQEKINVVGAAGTTLLTGSGVPQMGVLELVHPLTILSPNDTIRLKANSNTQRAFGLSAFTLSWDPVPEPSTCLLTLLGTALLISRRRRS